MRRRCWVFVTWRRNGRKQAQIAICVAENIAICAAANNVDPSWFRV
jgi:hypothetical protein